MLCGVIAEVRPEANDEEIGRHTGRNLLMGRRQSTKQTSTKRDRREGHKFDRIMRCRISPCLTLSVFYKQNRL